MATASASQLQALFGMPPEQAIKYLESKGYQITYDWYDMLRSSHSRAFTVAKATSEDVLKAIRSELEKALRQGLTFEQFKANLQPRLVEMGWWGKAPVLDAATGELTTATLGTMSRLRTIFQTNMATAYSAARYQRIEDNKQARPYLMYVAVMDGRTRPEHAELDNRVFHVDDPIWNTIQPPNGWGCRCSTIALTAEEVQRMGLRVESSTGSQMIEVPVNKDGDTVQVQSVQVMGRNGKPVWFKPDPGWDYNPGKAWPAEEPV